MILGYARVSTVEQTLDSQISILQRHNCEKIFEDVGSGKYKERKGLETLMQFAREGDHIFVSALDRLGRDVRDLRSLIDFFMAKKVNVTIISQNLNFIHDKKDVMTDMAFTFLSMISEYERVLVLERQREGIARARKAGKYKGRKPCLSEEQDKELKYLKDLGLSISSLARKFRVNRYTIYNHLRKMEQKEQGDA